LRYNGRFPGSLTAWSAQTPVCACKISRLCTPYPCENNRSTTSVENTGGEFTTWLPASHQTGRSLNSYVDTYLRASLLLLTQYCNELDYTNQGEYVKLGIIFFIVSIDFCSSAHFSALMGCFRNSAMISRIFASDGCPYCSTTLRVQGKNHK